MCKLPLIVLAFSLFAVIGFSTAVPIEITAGAFWKKLPDTITYEATIPLSYETAWTEAVFSAMEERDTPCYDTAAEGSCATHYQFKTLAKAFAEEIRLLDNTYQMNNMRETNNSRHKRALDFIGEGFSWCCGFATDQKLKLIEGDETSVRRRLDTITDTISSSLRAMAQDTTRFSQYEEQVRSTFQETERRLKFMGTHLQQMQQNAAKAEQQLQGLIHTLLHNDFSAFKLSITVARLLRKQSILSSCQDHKLSSSILHPTVLQEDLSKLSADLRLSHQELAIPVTDIYRYYKLPPTECAFTTSKLFVLIKIPILQTKKRWELFELVTVPFAWYNQTCSIPHRPLYLAANKLSAASVTETRQISGTGLHQCRPYHDKLCYISRFSPEALEGPECAKKLFTGGTVREISQHCPIKCNPSTHMIVSEVLEDTYIVTHPVTPLTITCGTNKTTLPDKYNHQGALKIRLVCSCYLEAGSEVLIPSRFPCLDPANRPVYAHIIPGISSNLKTFVLNVHDQRQLPTYADMDECLNANWSIEIPHLNVTFQEDTLREMQWKLDHTRSEIQGDKNTKNLVTFLVYWSIIASLVIVFLFFRLNQVLLILTTPRAARAEDGTVAMDHVLMGILWLGTVILSAILLYYCIHSAKRRVTQWYGKRTHCRNQSSEGNAANIALKSPVTQNDNPGFIAESVPMCLNWGGY
ncbi:hypothetical protein ABEB36_014176 [Hypothenemus hampei]|uniref:Uncharacterized protein n=1 Tax=Hypothenemus hampei TaxID=57062 RepID=A0ABD1E3J7_HYPHA